ncbi:MAG TPA: CYCXC family (seleno)protein [Longimicrobiaceae bacterium]|jgi:hypothetical protein|nr:CYCXC family (seleno)protein [Longimicrobiaceae bacterium]
MAKTPRGARPARKLPVPLPILALLLVTLAAVAYSLFPRSANASEHPDPRPGVTAAKVLPASRFAADDPRIAEVYAEVAQIPEVVDGIYCHCDCHHHAGHRSLLSCFESDHGAQCGTCMGEAHLAYQMAKSGATLKQIREAVDKQFG